MPLPNRHLTSVLLRREGDLMLFDCGEGTQVSLRSLNLKWKKISVIFISHTHADHITGLPGILMLSSQVDRDEPLYIIGPPKIKEYIESSRRVLDMYINYEIIIKEYEPSDGVQTVFEHEDYIVKAFPLRHSKPCLGYALEEKDRPGVFNPGKARDLDIACGPLWSKLQSGESVENQNGDVVSSDQVMGPLRKGRKFSFVTDTMYFDGIAPQVENSDLLICEGMFEKALEVSAREKKHLTTVQSATIATDAGVKRMGLIHYSPRCIEPHLRRMLKEARKVFPETFLTRDRMILELPYED